MSVQIIFTCRDYVIVNKPYGMLSENSGNDPSACLPAVLAQQLRESGIPFEDIYPIHRLDRTTAGLICYALTKAAAAKLSALVSERKMRKCYTALITRGPSLPDEGEMTDFLFFDRRADKAYVASKSKTSAKEARLAYRIIGEAEIDGTPVSAAHVELFTGRTHQIRVQFASRKSPLAGDRKYGSRIAYKAPALFSTMLAFEWKGEPRLYEIPVDLAALPEQ